MHTSFDILPNSQMNSVSAICSSDIPIKSMSIHPRWYHLQQYSVSHLIADSFSLPLNALKHLAQYDVDPSNVSIASSTSLSDESSLLIASDSSLSESDDNISSNFFGALHSHFGLGAANVTIAVAFAFLSFVFSFSSCFFLPLLGIVSSLLHFQAISSSILLLPLPSLSILVLFFSLCLETVSKIYIVAVSIHRIYLASLS